MAENNEKDFLLFYDKHADAIFRYCLFRVFDREKAKDVVQETFCKTWEYLTKNEVKNVRALAYRVANNIIIDQVRTSHPAESLEDLNDNGFDIKDTKSTIEKNLQKMEIDEIRTAIKQLDPLYQDVIILRYINEFGPKEISGIINKSEDVVSVRINRGLKQLRQIIKI